jgi:hypothetical protein
VARSKLSQSTIQYPARTSWLSAYGPSVTTGTSLRSWILRVWTGAVSPRVSTSSPDSARSLANPSMNAPSAANSSWDQVGLPSAARPAMES